MSALLEPIASALALWLALVLLVPKRDWRTIRSRLRATALGGRHHPFAPPPAPRREVRSPLAKLLIAEIPRCLELGVPLWLAALVAEERGRQRRRLAVAEWASSPAGWMWAHLQSRISRRDMEQRLADRGYPPPAPKAELRLRLTYRMPPMSWLREHGSAALDAPPPSVTPDGSSETERHRGAHLTIQMLGSLRILHGDHDLTTQLLDRPTVSYLCQYLLLRAIHEPALPILRTAIAEELYPGVDPDVALGRLRRRLYDIQRKIPQLGQHLVITDRDLRFDITDCQVDVVEILRLAEQTGPDLLSAPMAHTIEEAIAASAAEALRDWEGLQESINSGRGAAEEYVRTLRALVAEARVSLLIRVGTHQRAVHDDARAAMSLDEAFRLEPDRPGLAQLLAETLEAAGHRARAADVRMSIAP